VTSAASLSVGAPIPSLTRWGLSSDADLVFRTLTTFGARPARELAGDLGLPRQRVENALSELHECGAAGAAMRDGRTLLWSSRPADEVVQRLRARRLRPASGMAAVQRQRAVFDTLNARLTGLGMPLSPPPGGTVGDGIRYLPNRPLSRQRLAMAMRQERHEHIVINNEEIERADVVPALPYHAEGFPHGVKFRVIGQPPRDGDTLSPERQFGGSAYQFRSSVDTPLKLFVCDRRTAFVLADPADLDRGYFEVTHPEVVRTLLEIFESRWRTAVDPRASGVPVVELSRRERDLVKLLAHGHTDITAAQELRISARSVTNALRALMDRLGVDNRFQLGLALGALEVIVPPSLSSPASAAQGEETAA
jgi:DNA-binding CsgD family transcriptional regulator